MLVYGISMYRTNAQMYLYLYIVYDLCQTKAKETLSAVFKYFVIRILIARL